MTHLTALKHEGYFSMESEAEMPTIVLDPGHGQYGNQYPANKKFYEGTQMFKLAGYLQEALKAHGFSVLNTRSQLGLDPALAVRGSLAAESQADLFLSLHSNAIGPSGTSEVRGVEIYYSMTDEAWNKPFAEGLGKVIAETMQTPYRFARSQGMPNNTKRDYFQVVRSAAESGCRRAMLIEHGYHTNPTDTAFLVDSERLKQLAEAEAAYIAKAFGMRPKPQEEKEKEYVKPLLPANYGKTDAHMITCGGFVTEAARNRGLERIRLIYPEAGPRTEKDGVLPKNHIIVGRYKGTLKEAEAIASDFEKLTGMITEAWAW